MKKRGREPTNKKEKDNDFKKNKFGRLPIKKYKVNNHYHIIVFDEVDKYISLGLTSDKPTNDRNQKLHKVYESNGKIARLKRNADFENKNKYSKYNMNFKVDKETEKKAIKIAENKKRKQIGRNQPLIMSQMFSI